MVIGIIGGGQLAKMMVLAGYPMGQEFIILDPSDQAAAGRVAKQIVGHYDDPEKLKILADSVDVVTFDFENVPASALELLQSYIPTYPPPPMLAICQDRLHEKKRFNQYGIETANYRDINSLEKLKQAVDEINTPAVLKTRRLGYDGKGQSVIRSPSEITSAWDTINQQPAILEAFVPFDFEVSLLSVRNTNGDIAFYPLVHNTHQNGILHLSVAPYENAELQQRSEQLIKPMLEELNYVGVLAVEFFVKDQQLIANEMAPRVHNSGHWTIEGAGVSQFENHLRAIIGLPLGTTQVQGYAAMINFVSTMPPAEEILKIPGCHFHDYGKSPRPGRKLGHTTMRANNMQTLQEKIEQIEQIIKH